MKFQFLIPNFISFIMDKPRHLVLVSILLFAVSGVKPAAAQSGSSFKLHVDVDLVTIEVCVLDGNGYPVRHLKKEDFRLYEDGKRQEILSFDEVDGDADIPPSAMPIIDGGDTPRGKTVLIIFDERTIPTLQSGRIHESAADFVRRHMQPQDLFGVASWIGSMRIIQNFTDDREAVIAAIAQSARYQGWGPFEDFLRSLEQINYSIASIKGQKSVLIYGRPASTFGMRSADAYNNALNSARKSGVIYHVVDTGTVAAGIQELPDFLTVENRPPPLPAKTPIQEYNMGPFAAASGGSIIRSIDRIETELDKLNQQISNYYILGFQSGNPKHEGAFRKVRITTRVKDADLKYQQGYQDRRPTDILPSSKQEQMLLTALATPGTDTQLPVKFRPVCFFDSPGPARVLLAAEIRTDKMPLRRKDGQIGTDLNIMGAAYAEDGSIVARFSEARLISFDKRMEPEFRKQNLPYLNYFRLRPGKYRLKIAVSDDSNSLGSMEQFLEVPARPDQGLAFSSLVVVEQLSKMPDLIQKLSAQLLEYADPLLYAGARILPSVENRLPADSAVSILFRIYNLSCRPEECRLVASPTLQGKDGQKFSLPQVNLKDAMFPAGVGEAVVGLWMPFRNVPPGKYQLAIEIMEPGSNQTETLQTDIEFVAR